MDRHGVFLLLVARKEIPDDAANPNSMSGFVEDEVSRIVK